MFFADRVQETTTTTGTGTINLGGAATQCQSFVSGVGSGVTCDYCLLSGNGTDWETGNGKVTSGSPSTLSRTTIFESSNSGSAISLTGTSTVYLTLTAKRIVPPTWVQPEWTLQTISGSGSSAVVGGTKYQVTSWSNPGSGSLTSYALSFTRQAGSDCDLYFVNGSGNGYLLDKQNDGNLVWYKCAGGSATALGAINKNGAGNEVSVVGPWTFMLTLAIGGASNNTASGRDFCSGGIFYAINDTTYDMTSGSWTLYVVHDSNGHTSLGSLYTMNALTYPFGM